jgi:calcineurin-like phosphoesterase family protein
MSRLKKAFFTSDWHIGHANVIKFDKRPFTDLEHMHRVLINNYNSCVGENDICYFLGDMGLTNADTLKSVITKLNGTKVMIMGNHDKGVNSMYDCGFDVVLNSATLYIANERVTLSHCPLPGLFREDATGMKGAQDKENWHGEYRHKQFVVPNEGQFHLHGHIHSPNGGRSEKILGKQYDVGVPANSYRPVSISTIESWIALYKRENYEG